MKNGGTEYYDGFRPDNDIERAGRFFTLRYTQFSGDIENKGGFASCCGTRDNAGRFPNAVESLTEFRQRLHGVEIESRSAFEVLDRHDSKNTVFYADPPYEGTEGRYNSEGFNHRKLSEKAKEIGGKIVISYDSIPPFYGDAFTVVSKESKFSGGNTNGQNDCTEYLIMNYDPDSTPMFSEAQQETLF